MNTTAQSLLHQQGNLILPDEMEAGIHGTRKDPDAMMMMMTVVDEKQEAISCCCCYRRKMDDTEGDDGSPSSSLLLPPPGEIINLVLSYVSDPVTVCRFSAVGKPFHNAVTTNQTIWPTLSKLRWKIAPIIMYSSADGNNTEILIRSEYVRRHVSDHRVTTLIKIMARQMEQLPNFGLEYGWHWGSSFWKRLVIGIQQEPAAPVEAMDVLRELSVVSSENSCSTTTTTTTTTSSRLIQCVATQALDAVHNIHIQNELRKLQTEIAEATTSSETTTTTDLLLLEKGAILIGQSLACYDDLLLLDVASNDNSVFQSNQKVKQSLDYLGECLLGQLKRVYGTDNRNYSDVVAVQMLIQIMVHEQGFLGNSENYYNAYNSSIAHVLTNRKGNPITLAVIYKLILQRINVSVDIIGLPGHVVLGLSNDDRTFFIDVFHRGRILTLQDCMSMVQLRGFIWRASMLDALTTTQILIRMLHNVYNCRRQKFGRERSVRSVIDLERAHGLLSVMLQQQDEETTASSSSSCAEEEEEAVLTLDPGIFRKHNLIDDNTFESCSRASISRAFGVDG